MKSKDLGTKKETEAVAKMKPGKIETTRLGKGMQREMGVC